jgi:hypothetical protein
MQCSQAWLPQEILEAHGTLKLSFLKIFGFTSRTAEQTVVRGTLARVDMQLPLSAGDAFPPLSGFWGAEILLCEPIT